MLLETHHCIFVEECYVKMGLIRIPLIIPECALDSALKLPGGGVCFGHKLVHLIASLLVVADGHFLFLLWLYTVQVGVDCKPGRGAAPRKVCRTIPKVQDVVT